MTDRYKEFDVDALDKKRWPDGSSFVLSIAVRSRWMRQAALLHSKHGTRLAFLVTAVFLC